MAVVARQGSTGAAEALHLTESSVDYISVHHPLGGDNLKLVDLISLNCAIHGGFECESEKYKSINSDEKKTNS